MIYENIQRFLEWADDRDRFNFQRPIYLTSGGFDPLHVGHLRCIQETVYFATNHRNHPRQIQGLVVVLVNCDRFLHAKKGYVFMKLQDRMEIVNEIKGVDAVIPWFYEPETGDSTVTKAIAMLKPAVFTKGGDRKDMDSIPEWGICKNVGTKLITGVGGDKIRSSSELVEKADRFNLEAVEMIGWNDGYFEAKKDK